MKIRRKLALLLLPLAAGGVAAMTVLSRRAVEGVLLDEARARAQTAADTLARRPSLAASAAKDDETALLLDLQDAVHAGASYAAAVGADGRIIAHTDVSRRHKPFGTLPGPRGRRVKRRGRPFLEAASRIHPASGLEDLFGEAPPLQPTGWVVVGVPLEPPLAQAARIEARLFAVFTGIVAAMILLALAFLGWALRPVRRLVEATRRVGGGELGGQVEVRSKDELGDLAESFNAMSRRLRQITVSKSFLDGILESMLDGLVVAGADGAVRMANPSALRALHGESAQLLGRSLADLLPEADAARAASAPAANREGTLLVRGDGAGTPVLFSAAPLASAEGGWAVTFKDISDIKAAQAALAEKARELERSNKELEQFAYVASHDLQEPLRKIANFTQLLERRYKGRLDPDADQSIAYIVDGTHRMRDLIQDLLAYSRAGRGDLRLEPVALRDLVEGVLEDLEPARAEVDARVEVGRLPAVIADRARLRQVFQNVIANALKFRAKDRPPVIRVTSEERPREWRVFIDDNGIGVEPQYRERVFVIFQRLHSRAEYAGTGIGLAICRRIVEAHGGRIWIEDKEGPGTRFVLALPKRRAESGPPA